MKQFFLLITFCLSCFAAWAVPVEKIERFSSFAVVNEDSSVSVTETIAVQSYQDKIRRGIFRVLPYKGVSDYELVSVTRDGKNEPYQIENTPSAKTVYIGNSSRILPAGKYIYELSYVVKGAVRFQKEFDEFYWNVTGNDWQFPIQSASFRLSLPPGAQVIADGVSYYTGASGEKGQDAYRPHELAVEVTRPLAAGEGLTVSVAWNKGVVKEPFYKSQIFVVVLLLVWLLLLVYYYWAWNKVGKDPETRVLRRFTPPDGLSPAQVRYVRLMGWDEPAFSVIIISLVQKGYMEVKKASKSEFTLMRLTPSAGVSLSPEEQVCLDELFKEKDCIKVDNKFAGAFQSAESAACGALDSWAGKRFFSHNKRYNLPGYLFVAAWIVLVAVAAHMRSDGIPLACCVVMAIQMLWVLGKYFCPRVADKIPFFWLMLLGALLVLYGWRWSVLSAVVFVPGVIFAYLVRAYTVLGRQKMDEIEGFLQYVEVAETNRVFASNPTDAARIYCDYLPYAVALDVQNKWWNAFERELGKAAAEQVLESQGYSVMSADEFLGLFSAVRSASVPSSSYSAGSSSGSGFGGGGCSGGGSGGGGGGGW